MNAHIGAKPGDGLEQLENGRTVTGARVEAERTPIAVIETAHGLFATIDTSDTVNSS